MQLQRLELKYKITEGLALRLRDFVRSYLELDEYGVGKPNLCYPVHSLYLDSDDLRLYWDTINGNKNRFKLRLRYYNEDPDSPVFFEIKRRMNSCIMKQRGGVRRSAVEGLLSGMLPSPEHLISDNPKYLVALQNFCQRMMTLRATPKAHIAYLREAWVSHNDNSVRVTFDREVRCSKEYSADLKVSMQDPVMVFGPEVILEVKFTNRFPLWLEDMIRHFGLNITGAAKYVEGVALVGEERFNQPAYHLPQVVPVPLVEEEPASLPLELMAKFRELQRIS
ncbi:MAG TPA: polyphosphate polymerase domain-containing protein [Candidatus Paceibacterota bacterium]|nr:polyphosphate polymerase domain-containing protein [Verrucomicrobiota bacterium]HRY48356.1 polyphosphate polymerase domain-containing protein [Candidatus Paceibacterota bacterium]